MTDLIKIHNKEMYISNSILETFQGNLLVEITVKNVLLALQWEAFLVYAVLGINNAIVHIIGKLNSQQLDAPEAVINGEPWPVIDVRNVDYLGNLQQAAGKKAGGKKKKKGNGDEGKEAEKKEEELAKKRKEEEERQRKWEESWEKKLQAQEELDNLKCCKGEGLVLKPRTQSNIWINITQDKMLEEVQMTFKHLPVPKPKPPPLPRLKLVEITENVPTKKETPKKAKKGGSRKKK